MSIEATVLGDRDTVTRYVFPQLIINERTGQLTANLIDSGNGRVLQHISAALLRQIIQDQRTSRQDNNGEGDRAG
jgi:hypothetical protein